MASAGPFHLTPLSVSKERKSLLSFKPVNSRTIIFSLIMIEKKLTGVKKIVLWLEGWLSG